MFDLTLQHEVDEQIDVLGLDIDPLLQYDFILDIGCGIDARLVTHLREQGTAAEGIDPKVKEIADHLMRSKVTGAHPMPGHIPRPDNTYTRVVTMMLSPLYQSSEQLLREINFQARTMGLPQWMPPELTEKRKEDAMLATYILLEAYRVVKPGGRIICFPVMSNLDGFKSLEKTARIETEKANGAVHLAPQDGEAMRDLLSKRTIIYKE